MEDNNDGLTVNMRPKEQRERGGGRGDRGWMSGDRSPSNIGQYWTHDDRGCDYSSPHSRTGLSTGSYQSNQRHSGGDVKNSPTNRKVSYDEQENWEDLPPKSNTAQSRNSGVYDPGDNWEDEPSKHINKNQLNSGSFKHQDDYGKQQNTGNFDQHDKYEKQRNTNRFSGNFYHGDDKSRLDKNSMSGNLEDGKNRGGSSKSQGLYVKKENWEDNKTTTKSKTNDYQTSENFGLYDQSENWEDDTTNKIKTSAKPKVGMHDQGENWEDPSVINENSNNKQNTELYDPGENWETTPQPVEFKAVPSDPVSSPFRRNCKPGCDRKLNKTVRIGRRNNSAQRQASVVSSLSAEAPEWAPDMDCKRPRNRETSEQFHAMQDETDQLEWHYTEDPKLYNSIPADLTESNLKKLNIKKEKKDDDLNNSAESLERFIVEHTLRLGEHGIGIAPITTVTSSEDEGPIEDLPQQKNRTDWAAMVDTSGSDFNMSQTTSDLESSAGLKSPAKSSRSTDDDLYLDANASTPEQLDGEKPRTIGEHVYETADASQNKETAPEPELFDKDTTPVAEDKKPLGLHANKKDQTIETSAMKEEFSLTKSIAAEGQDDDHNLIEVPCRSSTPITDHTVDVENNCDIYCEFEKCVDESDHGAIVEASGDTRDGTSWDTIDEKSGETGHEASVETRNEGCEEDSAVEDDECREAENNSQSGPSTQFECLHASASGGSHKEFVGSNNQSVCVEDDRFKADSVEGDSVKADGVEADGAEVYSYVNIDNESEHICHKDLETERPECDRVNTPELPTAPG